MSSYGNHGLSTYILYTRAVAEWLHIHQKKLSRGVTYLLHSLFINKMYFIRFPPRSKKNWDRKETDKDMIFQNKNSREDWFILSFSSNIIKFVLLEILQNWKVNTLTLFYQKRTEPHIILFYFCALDNSEPFNKA